MNIMQTVNGHRVVVHEMNGNGTFAIKGTIMRKSPKENSVLRYEIWRPDGRVSVFNPSPWDLVVQ